MSTKSSKLSARQLEFFLAVVEAGSVTHAAERLHISQPSVSEAIRNLETELGATLFTRHRGGMEPTAAGLALTGPSAQLIEGLQLIEESARSITSIDSGRLEVGTPSGLIAEPFTRLAAQFHTAHPHVQIEVIRPTGIDRVLRLVQDRRCEVGLTFLTDEIPDSLVVHELEPVELYLAFPLQADPPPTAVTPKQLAGFPLIVLRTVTTPRRTLERYCADHGVTADVAIETNHEGGYVQMVNAGAGVALLSRASAHLAEAIGLPVRPLDPPIALSNGLVHRREEPSPGAQAFIDLVRAHA